MKRDGEEKLGVLVDRELDESSGLERLDGARVERVEPAQPLDDVMKRLLDDGARDVVVVWGDDRLHGRLATWLHGRSRGALDHRVRLVALPVGELHTVADAVGVKGSLRAALRRLGRGVDGLDRVRLPTLKVSASADPTARYGFNVGLGAFFAGFEAYQRRARGGALGLAETLARVGRDAVLGDAFEPTQAEVSVDYVRQASRFGFLVASSLPRTWLDIAMGDAGVGMRLGDHPAKLLQPASRLGRLVERGLGGGARPFERIHIDTDSGYVLDGELHASLRPQVVQVAPGPSVDYLRV